MQFEMLLFLNYIFSGSLAQFLGKRLEKTNYICNTRLHYNSESITILFRVWFHYLSFKVHYHQMPEEVLASNNFIPKLDMRENTSQKLQTVQCGVFWLMLFWWLHFILSISLQLKHMNKIFKANTFSDITNLPWAWKSRRRNCSSWDTALLARWCFWCNKSTS